jgi:hypothetical protein
LYEFAGRWPRRRFGCTAEHLVPLLGGNDRLRKAQFVESAPEGKITFLAESQGVWYCRTLPAGDDPPVWKSSFRWKKKRGWIPYDKLISRSLSCFLTTFVLREIAFGSHISLFNKQLNALFSGEIHKASPVWLDGEYAHDGRHDVYLWDQVLVLEDRISDRSGYWFGANSSQGIRFLREHQSPIGAITILDIGADDNAGWSLDIRADGSATLRSPMWMETSDATLGVFDFQAVRQVLLQSVYYANYEPGNICGDPLIAFWPSDGCELPYRCHLPRQVAKVLFERALDRGKNVRDELRIRFAKRWGT